VGRRALMFRGGFFWAGGRALGRDAREGAPATRRSRARRKCGRSRRFCVRPGSVWLDAVTVAVPVALAHLGITRGGILFSRAARQSGPPWRAGFCVRVAARCLGV
jgi:hypothetical protein